MAYIYGVLVIIAFPFLVSFVGYGVVKLSNSHRREIKVKRDQKRLGLSEKLSKLLPLSKLDTTKITVNPKQHMFLLKRGTGVRFLAGI